MAEIINQVKKYKNYLVAYFLSCVILAIILIIMTYCAEVCNYEWGIEEYKNGRLLKESEIRMVEEYLSDPLKVKACILLDKILSVFCLMIIMQIKLFKFLFVPLVIFVGVWFYKRGIK